MTEARGRAAPVIVEDVYVDRLRRLASLAADLGSDRIQAEATALAHRAAEGRFYVACVGQFKRGKSTLINALLGERILPVGVLPVTSVPTVLRYGRSRVARVQLAGKKRIEIPLEDLPQFVSEELNPENRKGVVGVEVFASSPFLAQGMCFVDTPGLGSVFAGNAAATRAFVPHIDAAIIVLGADPPISGEELSLVSEIAQQVENFVVVLNKADKASADERAAAKSFTARMLEDRLGRPVGSIYEVSAEERLANQPANRDWEKFAAALEKLVSESGHDLARAAGERGFARLAAEVGATISGERAALVRPLEESELHIGNLRRTISEAERSLRELSYLFSAEEHRISDLFLDRRKKFLATAMPAANSDFASQLKALPRRAGPKFRREVFCAAQSVAQLHVQPFLANEQAAAEQEYRGVALRFASIGNNFLAKLAASGVPELARLPGAIDPQLGFCVPSRFTFEQLLHVALPASPLRYIADMFLGIAQAHAMIEKQAQSFLAYLMEMNSTRVQSDIVNRVQESRSRLEVEIRELLRDVMQIAESALTRARTARTEGASAVEAALSRLAHAEESLNALRAYSQPSLPIGSPSGGGAGVVK